MSSYSAQVGKATAKSWMFVFVTVSAVNGINAAGRLHMAVAVGHYVHRFQGHCDVLPIVLNMSLRLSGDGKV